MIKRNLKPNSYIQVEDDHLDARVLVALLDDGGHALLPPLPVHVLRRLGDGEELQTGDGEDLKKKKMKKKCGDFPISKFHHHHLTTHLVPSSFSRVPICFSSSPSAFSDASSSTEEEGGGETVEVVVDISSSKREQKRWW